MKSRKFWGCMIATVLVVAVFFITLGVHSEAITPAVVMMALALVVTIWFAYIGGNVWATWAKSKYFRSELAGK